MSTGKYVLKTDGWPSTPGLDRRGFLASAGVAAAVLGAGVAPARGQEPQGGPRARWRIGTPVFKADSMFQNMGVEKGFFDEEGIDAEIIGLESSATITRGVLSGELEMGSGGAGSPIVAIAQGGDLRIIGSVFSRVPHLMYASKSISAPEDLVGKDVGGAQPGALLQQLAYASLQESGVDVSKVRFVNTGGSPATFQAVAAGLVQAGVAGSEYALMLESDPSIPAHVLYAVVDKLPSFLRNADFVSTSILTEQPDLVLRAVRAYLRGVRYALEHKDEAVEWAVDNAGVDQAVAEAVWEEYVEGNFVNSGYVVSEEQIRYTQEVNLSTGLQTDIVEYDAMVDRSIAEGALASL